LHPLALGVKPCLACTKGYYQIPSDENEWVIDSNLADNPLAHSARRLAKPLAGQFS